MPLELRLNFNAEAQRTLETAKLFKSPALGVFLAAFVAAIIVGLQVAPTWTVKKLALEIQTNDQGREFVEESTHECPNVFTLIDCKLIDCKLFLFTMLRKTMTCIDLNLDWPIISDFS